MFVDEQTVFFHTGLWGTDGNVGGSTWESPKNNTRKDRHPTTDLMNPYYSVLVREQFGVIDGVSIQRSPPAIRMKPMNGGIKEINLKPQVVANSFLKELSKSQQSSAAVGGVWGSSTEVPGMTGERLLHKQTKFLSRTSTGMIDVYMPPPQ